MSRESYARGFCKVAGVISDYYAYGPVGILAARRDQINNELAEVLADSEKNKGADPKAHAIAETISPLTSNIGGFGIGATLGGIVGGLINKEDRVDGALTGAAMGGAIGVPIANVANLAGALAAAINRRRTRQEQIENDKGSVLKTLFLPGKGLYDLSKRIGVSIGDNEEKINHLAKMIALENEKRRSKNNKSKKSNT